MMIALTLKDDGPWWQVEVFNADNIKEILNTGYWLEIKIYALMIQYENNPMIYDFALRKWR